MERRAEGGHAVMHVKFGLYGGGAVGPGGGPLGWVQYERYAGQLRLPLTHTIQASINANSPPPSGVGAMSNLAHGGGCRRAFA